MIKNKERMLSRSVRLMFSGGMVLSLSVLAQNALAQENAGKTEKPEKVETVEITGTRITTPGTTSNSPISSISEAEIRTSQPVAVEEFIKDLPIAVPAIGSGTNNGTSGAATIDLRGLGPNRTLVLVDGRRFVPFNLFGVVDTNSIPLALINRVDLVTGGASAVYGADAVAGVVNFNLKKNFQGFDVTSSYGLSEKGDAKRDRIDVTMGAALDDGRGNVVLSLGKTKVDPLTQGVRTFGQSALSSTTGLPSGSGTAVPVAISVPKGPGGTSDLSGTQQIDPTTGKIVPFYASYNFNPINYFVTGLDSQQATSLANYKINDHAEAYAELFYTQSKVASAVAPSGTFLNVYNVPIGNPYIPDAARQQICARQGISAVNCVVGNPTLVPMSLGRRFTEMGPRYNNFDNKTLQYTLGMKGDVVNDWTYDAYFSRGTADQTQTRKNWGSFSKVSQALNATSTTTCKDPSNGCVPLNVFGPDGSINSSMLGFINESAISLQSVQQDVASVSVSGDLGNKFLSPWAANSPITLAFGAERRKMTASTQSDAASQIQGEVLGTGAPTPDRTGSFTMKELFIESFVPILKDKAFARSLNLELGFRQTDFSTTGTQSYNSYKYGGEWEPVKGFRFRGMMQRATRAPNINELYAPQVTGLSNQAVDPCQGALINAAQANTPGTLSNLCRLTGVPIGAIGSLAPPSSGQINNLSGGNPNLGPEVARTKTIGFVWEPLPKLAVSLDYYTIDIDKAISSPSTTDILSDCYDPSRNPGLTLNSSCGYVQRSPITGSFNGNDAPGVVTLFSNQGKQATSGLDLNVAYGFGLKELGLDPKWGSLTLGFSANEVRSFTFQATPSTINRDCLGYYSNACGNIGNSANGLVYKHKFSQRTTWNVGDWNLSYNWRYEGPVDVEPSTTTYLPAYSHIDAFNYVDLAASWNYSKNLKLSAGVLNAFNKNPPVVGSTIGTTTANSGNTFPQNYDTVGRYFSLAASLKF